MNGIFNTAETRCAREKLLVIKNFGIHDFVEASECDIIVPVVFMVIKLANLPNIKNKNIGVTP